MLKFCPECGSKVVGGRFCGNCGADLNKYCQTDLNSQAVSTANNHVESEVKRNESAGRDKLDLASNSDGAFTVKGVKDKLIKSIVIPDNVTVIDKAAFANCNGLTSVTIPNSVKWIGDYAFRNCSSLLSVIIPSSVTHIGEGAFYNCGSLSSVTIPNSVSHISRWAFEKCSSLSSVTISRGCDCNVHAFDSSCEVKRR